MELFNFLKKDNKSSSMSEHDRLVAEGDKLFNDAMRKYEAEDKRKEAQRQADENMNVDISARLSQMNYAPGSVRTSAIASSEAVRLNEQMFGSKKPVESQIVSSDASSFEKEEPLEFNDLFPQFETLKKIIDDSKAGALSSSISKRVSVITNMCRKRYPDFVLDEMLLPFLMEKTSLGLASEDEFLLVQNKYDSAILNGSTHEEYADRVGYCIITAGAFLGLEGEEFSKFNNSFEYCYSFIASSRGTSPQK